MVVVAGKVIMRELVQRWARTCEHNIQCCSCWLRAFGFDAHETHDVGFLKLHLRHGKKKRLVLYQSALVWDQTCLVWNQTCLVFKVLWFRPTPKMLTPKATLQIIHGVYAFGDFEFELATSWYKLLCRMSELTLHLFDTSSCKKFSRFRAQPWNLMLLALFTISGSTVKPYEKNGFHDFGLNLVILWR